MTLAIVSFLVVTLGVLGALHLLPLVLAPDSARVRRRLSEEFARQKRNDVPSALYKDLDVLHLDSAQEYALLAGKKPGRARLTAASLRKRVEVWLGQAKVPLSLRQFLAVQAALACVLALAGAWAFRLPGGLGGAAVAVALPAVVIRSRCKARRERLLEQLPGAFELMARVIRAGQSVPQALQAVAEAFEDPLATEFSGCLHQQNFGLAPEVVFQEMANRSGILEVRIFAMAMLIQQQCGGNLSEVLDRLAQLIRNRLRLRQQIRTATAEGRLQGGTLVVLPFIMFAVLFFINRRYAQALLDQRPLLYATGLCMLVGILWIRAIINAED
jgi:tight adherence protein B